MKTIAQQLNIKTFPFKIKNTDGNVIYFETSTGYWSKQEYDAAGNEIYRENSKGLIAGNRKTDVQKAIDLLTAEGLLMNGHQNKQSYLIYLDIICS